MRLPEGFLAGDEQELERKLERFAQAGPSAAHVLTDFDRTLTVASGDRDVTTWKVLSAHHPPAIRVRKQELYDIYRPMEINGTLTVADAADWWNSQLPMLVEAGINLIEAEESLLSLMTIRHGTCELFKLCAQLRIPSVILSAGVSNLIELWCKHFSIQPTQIISTELITDENGVVIDWNRERVVHGKNKAESAHVELRAMREERPFTILIGDSLDDAIMASGYDNVLRIWVRDHVADEHKHLVRNSEILQHFDLMMDTPEFYPLLILMQSLWN